MLGRRDGGGALGVRLVSMSLDGTLGGQLISEPVRRLVNDGVSDEKTVSSMILMKMRLPNLPEMGNTVKTYLRGLPRSINKSRKCRSLKEKAGLLQTDETGHFESPARSR